MHSMTANRRRRFWLLVSVAFVLALSFGCTSVEFSTLYENGALATAAPIATAVGVDVFKKGGNSFDVAVAVAFTLAVVHPEAGNIGGGGFALIHDGQSGSVRALDFRETAPAAAHEKMFLDDSGEVVAGLSLNGAMACGVPGTVAGLHELWQRYGSMPWEELVSVAAVLADTGFVVDAYLEQSLNDNKEILNRIAETAGIFYPNGRAPKAGDRLVQPDLAKTLYVIAAEGRHGFYEGGIAERIVRCMARHGGLISAEDLRAYRTIWREPVHFDFDGYDVYSMSPPSSGGTIIGQIMKLIEPFDFVRYSPGSSDYIHLFTEASRLAFADRSQHLGDPEFYAVPAGLLDDAYLENRREHIDLQHASSSHNVSPGIPPENESDQTTHFSVCDKNGNVVALTYTLNRSYGCGLVVDSSGFLLNNEMDDFSIKPGVPNLYGLVGGEANKIGPGKRMLSSMSPTIVLEGKRPCLVLGAPGGSRIITVVAQALVDYMRFNLNVVEICRQARFHHQWLPEILYLEQGGFDVNTIQDLIRFGHSIEECEPYSDLQIISVDASGLMAPASDPRKRGTSGGL
ncbi:MAG: gamma-glutamyltransferase [candidate division Zixibacteria bacterium]|nr:gamma-glutamyltransferase [candidate division Zixibacteria bacterium]